MFVTPPPLPDTALLMLLGQTTDPEYDPEIMFVMGSMMLGAMIHAALFGQMALLISNFNRAGSRYQETMDSVNEHTRNLGLEHDLSTRIQEYFEYQWHLNRCLDRNEFIATLSPTLQDEVCVVVTGDMLLRVPFLSTLETPCLVEMVKSLVTVLYLSGDYVIFEGRIGESMYFIREGLCDVLKCPDVQKPKLKHMSTIRNIMSGGEKNVKRSNFGAGRTTGGNKRSEKVFTLRQGDYFGELSMLLPNQKRTATVRAASNCDLLMLSRADFLSIMREFPESLTMVKDTVNVQLEKYTSSGAKLLHRRMSHFAKSGRDAFGEGVGGVAKAGGDRIVPDDDSDSNRCTWNVKLAAAGALHFPCSVSNECIFDA